MKFHHRLFVGVLIFLLSPMAANAIPITFTFDMPAFTTGTLAGTTSVLDVTVDNGGTSALSQIFLNTQITALNSSAGGQSSSVGYAGSETVLTTDGLGVAMLNFSSSNFMYTIGRTPVIQLYSGNYPFYVYNNGSWGAITGSWANSIGPITSQSQSVPEPSTLALLGLGLAGMGMTRRKKKV